MGPIISSLAHQVQVSPVLVSWSTYVLDIDPGHMCWDTWVQVRVSWSTYVLNVRPGHMCWSHGYKLGCPGASTYVLDIDPGHMCWDSNQKICKKIALS